MPTGTASHECRRAASKVLSPAVRGAEGSPVSRADLHPSMRAALQRHEEILAGLGPSRGGVQAAREHAARAREWWNEGGPAMESIVDREIPGPLRNIPVRVYVPRQRSALAPAFVYLHGGGWRMGSPASNDRQLRELARAWGGIVVSTDYAHVPEHVFPAPVDETVAVYQWLAEHGRSWGIDPSALAFGGTSAGANVALGAFHAAGQARMAMRCCVLIVGVFDDRLDTPSMVEHGDEALLPNRASAQASLEAYVVHPGDRVDPRYNAAWADLSPLPPTFLAAAQCDVFRDSSAALADRARSAGVQVEHRVYPGMTHLFLGYSRMLETAQRCLEDAALFLGRHLPVDAAA